MKITKHGRKRRMMAETLWAAARAYGKSHGYVYEHGHYQGTPPL
jgi:hypothetical protein